DGHEAKSVARSPFIDLVVPPVALARTVAVTFSGDDAAESSCSCALRSRPLTAVLVGRGLEVPAGGTAAPGDYTLAIRGAETCGRLLVSLPGQEPRALPDREMPITLGSNSPPPRSRPTRRPKATSPDAAAEPSLVVHVECDGRPAPE